MANDDLSADLRIPVPESSNMGPVDSAPITSPVHRKITPFEELSFDDQQKYLGLHLDTPQDFRDMHQRKKHPYRRDTF